MAIKSFRCAETKRLFERQPQRRWVNVQKVALRKLVQLNMAGSLADSRIPPDNQLEALQGDRCGHYSIRINDQWRICFVWDGTDAVHVEIVDYH